MENFDEHVKELGKKESLKVMIQNGQARAVENFITMETSNLLSVVSNSKLDEHAKEQYVYNLIKEFVVD